MRAQTLLNVTTAAAFRPELQGGEPFDIGAVEEHVADRDELLVDFVRVARENDPLCDDARRRRLRGGGWWEGGARCDERKRRAGVFGPLEEQRGHGTPGQRADEGCHA